MMRLFNAMFRKVCCIFCVFACSASITYAQLSEWTMYNMEPVFQSVYFNPAAKPLNKVSIGLPFISSLSFDMRNTGFKVGDLIKVKEINPSTAIANMATNNFFSTSFSYDIFHFRIKIQKTFVGFYIQDNVTFMHSYPKDFYKLIWEGNVGFQNKTIDLKNLSLDMNAYRAYAFHASHEFKKLRIGTNIKYLTGFANVHSDINKMDLSFNDRFEVSTNADAAIYTAGLIPNDSTKESENSELQKKFTSPASNNKGWAIDIGATYSISKKFELGLAITNFGKINWKEEAYKRNINGAGSFQGFDVANEFLKAEPSSEEEITKKFENDFKYTTSIGGYSTWLLPRFTIQVRYNFTKNTYLTNNIFIEKYKVFRIANSLAVYHQFGRVLGASINATYAYKTINNLGLGVYAKLGPAQIYLVGDNLLGFGLRSLVDGLEINQKVIAPLKVFNFRLGMNLVFGRVSEPSSQSYEFK